MKRRSFQAGQVIPLVALSLTVLMGFSGMAVDHGYWQYVQRQQQSAVDAAAVGGAQALAAAGCPNQAAAAAAANSDAVSNGYANGVTVSNPPASGPYAGNNCAVSVQISATHASFFANAFGHNNMAETTAATAQLITNSSGCVYLLNPNATSQLNGGNISASGCGIVSNGSFSCKSETIDASAIGYAGSAPSCNGAKFAHATPAPMVPISNPCPEMAGCNYASNNPPSTSNCQTLKANMNPTISPGCYNTLTMGGCGTVTMLPGTYVLNGTSDFSGSSFVGKGVTFYVTSKGTPPNFSTADSATMSPPTSGSLANVLYYQVPGNTGAPNFAGSSVHFSGLVYAPSALNVNFDGAKGQYTVLVFGSAQLNDTSGYTFGTPPAGSTLIKNVVLAQ